MSMYRAFGSAIAAMGLLFAPSVTLAEGVSIELVEARAMTVERPSSKQGQIVTAQSGSATAGHRTALRDAARRETHSMAHQRSTVRDETRMGKAGAAGSARRQSDVAEHRQERRGAGQGAPKAGGNGKGANAG